MQIKHFKSNKIDRIQWDNCIESASNSSIYGKSWFLDLVSPGWEALISDDYEYIMPLPVKKKLGIRYLVQPYLTQQLGIFSQKEMDERLINSFIKKIPYLSYYLNLNSKNFTSTAKVKPNYILNLNKEYTELVENYSKNTLRNIKKARKSDLRIVENLDKNIFLSFFESIEKNFNAVPIDFIKYVFNSKNEIFFYCYGVYNSNNNLISALCTIKSPKQIIYLLPVSNSEGKSTSAMFVLTDEIISKYANTECTFDFEGSAVESIARFYKGFGAIYKPYYIIKRFKPSNIFF